MKTFHFIPSYISQPNHPITIQLIGCGGTGSMLLGHLARLNHTLRELDHPGLHVMAYDMDIVEPQNIGRQNFFAPDIGRNKAITLIERINFSYGVQWEAFNEKVTTPKNVNIVISCVDSASARKDFSNHFSKTLNKHYTPYSTPYYWLDTGNGKNFGQAILSTINSIKQPTSENFNTVDTLGDVFARFGDIQKMDNEEFQGMESCSVRESLKKQDLFINSSVAIEAAQILWELFRKTHIENYGSIINNGIGKTLPLKIAS